MPQNLVKQKIHSSSSFELKTHVSENDGAAIEWFFKMGDDGVIDFAIDWHPRNGEREVVQQRQCMKLDRFGLEGEFLANSEGSLIMSWFNTARLSKKTIEYYVAKSQLLVAQVSDEEAMIEKTQLVRNLSSRSDMLDDCDLTNGRQEV